MKHVARSEQVTVRADSLPKAGALQRWQFRIAVALFARLVNRGRVEVQCPQLAQPATIESGAEGDQYTMWLASPQVLWDIVRRPDPTLGEAFMAQRWELKRGDLGEFLTMLAAGRKAFVHTWAGHLYKTLTHFQRDSYRHDIPSSYSDVQSHYDLGNDLYTVFLDPDMNYSCAFFESRGDSLEQAQENKLRTTLERLEVEPGMRVLDIGCGWGATCRFIARHRQAQVTGITLAEKQAELAEQRSAGMSNKPRFLLQDYREHADTHAGNYDRLVSIGMLEHVGQENLRIYFAAVRKLLKSGGRAVIHSIVAPEKDTGKKIGSPWLVKYIFPGGYIPRVEEMAEAAERAGLTLDRPPCIHESFNYAETLRHWRRNFNEHYPSLDTGRYDSRFRRMWLYYFCMSEAMFAGHGCRVAQLVLNKAER